MAAASAFMPTSLFITVRKSHFANERKLLPSPLAEARFNKSNQSSDTSLVKLCDCLVLEHFHCIKARIRLTKIAAKAVGDGSDSSTESIVKYMQNAFDSSEDRIALVGLGFAAIAAIWASVNLITAIDRLPVVPGVLEFIGILVSWWFIYRYLLFKPDREELFKIVKDSLSDILGE